MTRQEFLDNVNDFFDLKNFCNDNRIFICDDVIDVFTYKEDIGDRVSEWDCEDWVRLRDFLKNLPDPVESWYRQDDIYDEYEVLLASDFYNYKQDVLDEADSMGVWDEEDEDEEEEDEEEAAERGQVLEELLAAS